MAPPAAAQAFPTVAAEAAIGCGSSSRRPGLPDGRRLWPLGPPSAPPAAAQAFPTVAAGAAIDCAPFPTRRPPVNRRSATGVRFGVFTEPDTV